MEDKENVKKFWNQASCGEELFLKGDTEKGAYIAQSASRYTHEPYIITFADFESTKGKTVLEVGVGLGSDHQKFAESGAKLYGIDLTQRAIDHTQKRLSIFRLKSELKLGDAERLEFPDNYFDIVYSWGVIHHSPQTNVAVKEIHRVLKPGGTAKVMIYHKKSIVGYLLWIRYALLTGRPLKSLHEIYSKYLESPGTKAYTITEGYEMFNEFRNVGISIEFSSGDLLSKHAGQRHKGAILSIARTLFPSKIVKRVFSRNGLFMLITAIK